VFARRRGRPQLTVYFATDIHGSEVCFRKFVAARQVYGADQLILGGDLTGKMVVPVVRRDEGAYEAELHGQVHRVGDDRLDELRRRIRDGGFYPVVMSPAELAAYDPAALERTFADEMARSIEDWDRYAGEHAVAEREILVAPGNDDPYEIDAVLARATAFRLVEGERVTIGSGDVTYDVVSTGVSNRTPWETHRELEEDALEAHLRALLDGADPARTILNVHVPPFASGLDEGPDVAGIGADGVVEQRKSLGTALTRPVGSTAVRRVIEDFQPLLSLHGHIHEGRGAVTIGATTCINPGSDYPEGVLRGAIVRFDATGIVNHQLTAG
jgi:Icc-related predicted phosphoesterase